MGFLSWAKNDLTGAKDIGLGFLLWLLVGLGQDIVRFESSTCTIESAARPSNKFAQILGGGLLALDVNHETRQDIFLTSIRKYWRILCKGIRTKAGTVVRRIMQQSRSFLLGK